MRQDQIARGGEAGARAKRASLYRAHDGLHERADAEQHAAEGFRVLAIRFARGAQRAGQRLEIGADAEVLAVGGKLDDTNVSILLELRAGGKQLRGHLAVDHIATFGSGKNDPTDGALSFHPNPRHHSAPVSPSLFASASGTSSVIRRSAVENTLPCASVFNDNVPPPSRAP